METFFDEEWVSSAFLVAKDNIAEYEFRYKDWSTADESLFSSRLGGNLVVNARPQYTRYADIRSVGSNADSQPVSLLNLGGYHGMGRFYSRQVNDNMEILNIRVGLVQYTSLDQFTRMMFDDDFAYFVNTGKSRSKTLSVVGAIMGMVLGFYLFGVAGLLLIGVRELSSFFGQRTSRFSSFKPAPHMYWSACSVFLNNILINEGFIREKKERDEDDRTIPPHGGDEMEVGGDQYLNKIHQLMPDVFIDKYGVDLFAIATKAQRIQDRRFRDRVRESGSTTLEAFVKGEWQISTKPKYNDAGAFSLVDFVKKFTTFGYFMEDGTARNHFTLNPKQEQVNPSGGASSAATNMSTATKSGTVGSPGVAGSTVDLDDSNLGTGAPSDADSYFEYFGALRQQAADFVSFRVDHISSISETFSTTVGESEISIKVNSASSAARETRFMLAGGNIADGAFSDVIGSISEGVSAIASKAGGTLTLGLTNALKGVFGAAFIDFPQVFKNSSVTLPTHRFSMDLNVPYNNSISRLINMHVPMSCIVPLILPLSAGRQSFTSPFALQAFVRGKFQSRYCMMKSLTVERGINNTPFDTDGKCMGFRISFDFVDMASIMHMPISTGPLFGGDSATDRDSILFDYLAILGGLDIRSQIYNTPQARINWAKSKTGFQLATSAAAWAMYSESIMRSKYVSFMSLGGSDILSGLTAGTNK